MDDCRAAVITAHNEPLEIRSVPIEDTISRSYRLEQVNEAMAAMANYEVVKPVINF